MPRLTWAILDANVIWTCACVLAVGAFVYWVAVTWIREVWHHSHAEAVATASRENAQQESLAVLLSTLGDMVGWLAEDVRRLVRETREDKRER